MNDQDQRTQLLAAVGARVRLLRLAGGLTVKAFAERAALSSRFAVQLEAGKANISIAGLARAAAALGRSIHELIPPASGDSSLRAQLWHRLSACSEEELEEIARGLTPRIAPPPPRIVALIGLRGAGKSTIGPLLAKRLKVDFVEVDALIERAAGMSLGEIFNLHGEEYYRRLEQKALKEMLNQARPCALAPGGSVVTDGESWELIKRRCFTVWLHATPKALMKRMRRQGDLRPMQGRPSAMNELKALLSRREPIYAESRLKIRTTNKPPAAVVAQIVKAVTAAEKGRP